MATESPLIHDGSQCVAAADLSPTAGLSGMNGSGQFLAVKISADNTVALQTSANGAVYGILQNQPKAGQAADVGIVGISKAMLGATVTAGANLSVVGTGGALGPYVSGPHVGIALQGGTSGQVISIALVPQQS